MIRCHMCGDLGDPEEMLFVSLLPSFTYLDSVLCIPCAKQLQELAAAGKLIASDEYDWVREFVIHFQEKYGFEFPDCGFFWNDYAEILSILAFRNDQEIVCPECGGLAVWDVEDLGDDGYGDSIFVCLNCNWWGYDTNGIRV